MTSIVKVKLPPHHRDESAKSLLPRDHPGSRLRGEHLRCVGSEIARLTSHVPQLTSGKSGSLTCSPTIEVFLLSARCSGRIFSLLYCPARTIPGFAVRHHQAYSFPSSLLIFGCGALCHKLGEWSNKNASKFLSLTFIFLSL